MKKSYDRMDGHTFEHYCAGLLRRNGFHHVEVTRGSGDQGIDILAWKHRKKYGIQCKCYSYYLGNKAIQEAYAGMKFYECDVAAVLTNQYFTNSAVALAGKTDVGSVRPENQDDYRAGELNSDAAWGLVCDGMGGARGGREASVSACDVIEHSFHEQYAQCLPGDEEKFLKRALINANRFVFQKASREEELAGMGTTAVCALVRGGNAFICHAGDSRAYLVRDGRLTQLTHDHSYVQELVDCGTITVEEAEHHPQKNIITRALGVDYRLEPEFATAQLHSGDILLLCSDGLTNAVPKEQLEQLLRTGKFYDLPDLLIRTANENGGPDNITALLLCVEEVR